MKRRDFLAVLGGASVCSVSSLAQQSSTPLVGFLDTSTSAQVTDFLVAFRRGLREECVGRVQMG
jgi:hypothetical protein